MPDETRKIRKTGRKRPIVTAVSADALNRVRRMVTPTLAERTRLDRIANGHAARLLAEVKDLLDAVRQRPEGRADELRGSGETGRGGGFADVRSLATRRPDGLKMPHETLLGGLPRNTDAAPAANAGPSERGAARGDAAAFQPSANVASWMSGAASSTDVRKDPATGIVEKTTSWENDDGTTTTSTTVVNPQEGTETTNQVTRQGRQERLFIQITDHRDGSSDGQTRVTTSDRVMNHLWGRDASGRLTTDYFQDTDRRGRTIGEWDRARNPNGGFARMPTGDEVSDLARRLGARFSHRPAAKPRDVTLVNPGDPDDSGPRGSRINPGGSIVVNPSPEHASSSRRVSADRARHWQEELRRRVGGIVNPGGGGTG